MDSTIERLFNLDKLIFEALKQENYYTVYVLMWERTTALSSIDAKDNVKDAELCRLNDQTSQLSQLIQENITRIQHALDREIQFAKVRTSYAKNSLNHSVT